MGDFWTQQCEAFRALPVDVIVNRWSGELGVVIVLDVILACCGLYLLFLYVRLDAAAKKFVWSHLGRFCALVTLSALLTATGRFAILQNQITFFQIRGARTRQDIFRALALAINWSFIGGLCLAFGALFSLCYRLLVLNRLFEFSLQKSATAAAAVVRRRFRFIVALVILGACVRFAAALAASVYARKLSELYSAWSEDISNSDFGQLQFEYSQISSRIAAVVGSVRTFDTCSQTACFLLAWIYCKRTFRIAEAAIDSVGFSVLVHEQKQKIIFLRKRVFLTVGVFIFASAVSATDSTARSIWSSAGFGVNCSSPCQGGCQPVHTVILTVYTDIPEPIFIRAFFEDVCCMAFALWSMTSLHMSLLRQKSLSAAGPRGTAVHHSTVTGRLEIWNYFSNMTKKVSHDRRGPTNPESVAVPLAVQGITQ